MDSWNMSKNQMFRPKSKAPHQCGDDPHTRQALLYVRTIMEMVGAGKSTKSGAKANSNCPFLIGSVNVPQEHRNLQRKYCAIHGQYGILLKQCTR